MNHGAAPGSNHHKSWRHVRKWSGCRSTISNDAGAYQSSAQWMHSISYAARQSETSSAAVLRHVHKRFLAMSDAVRPVGGACNWRLVCSRRGHRLRFHWRAKPQDGTRQWLTSGQCRLEVQVIQGDTATDIRTHISNDGTMTGSTDL